ncbi:hypothetical protein [Streptomyces sp. DSM 118148]|uniref:hypothetical protein n=1 Tax=Streptomyces sp. DSM 118148 TaxID=3448667 RepID=UPI00403FDE1C
MAATASSTAGVAAGLTASHFGLDPHQSAQIGAVVGGAVGNLLYQVFRLTPEDRDRNAVDAAPGSTGAVGPDTAASGMPNAAGTGSDTAAGEAEKETASTTEATAPGSDGVNPADRAAASGRKHPRHRKLERAARRRAERRDKQKEDGHGAA